MKKQQKQMLILAAILVILVGVFFLFKCVLKLDPEEEETGTLIWNFDKEDVTEISFSGRDDEFIELKKINDNWVLTGHEDQEIDASMVLEVIEYIDDVTVTEELGPVDDLTPFGLGDDKNVIKVVTDNDTYEMILGDYNNNIEGHYIQINGQSDVYVWNASSYVPFWYKTWESFVKEEDASSND